MDRMIHRHKLQVLGLMSVLLVVLAGCARTPEGAIIIERREMSFSITFNGAINDEYYYYLPIDVSGGSTGPIPVYPGTTTLQGWVTGSATHFVEYHAGQYLVYKITSLQPFTYELLGNPLRSTIPGPGVMTLLFTLDLDQIEATGSSVSLNMIAVNYPLENIRFIDGLGSFGNDYLNLQITSSRTFTNSSAAFPEASGDVRDQDGDIQAPGDLTNPLDITNWTIALNI